MNECWEYMGCAEDRRHRCPAYPDRGFDCWKFTGTLCDRGQTKKKTLEEKIAHCRTCDFYQMYAHRF